MLHWRIYAVLGGDKWKSYPHKIIAIAINIYTYVYSKYQIFLDESLARFRVLKTDKNSLNYYRIYSALDNSLRSRIPSKFKWHSWHVEADNVGWPGFMEWWSEGREMRIKRNISGVITLLLLRSEYSSRTLGHIVVAPCDTRPSVAVALSMLPKRRDFNCTFHGSRSY